MHKNNGSYHPSPWKAVQFAIVCASSPKHLTGPLLTLWEALSPQCVVWPDNLFSDQFSSCKFILARMSAIKEITWPEKCFEYLLSCHVMGCRTGTIVLGIYLGKHVGTDGTWRKVVHAPLVCITIRVPVVSRCFGRRTRGHRSLEHPKLKYLGELCVCE